MPVRVGGQDMISRSLREMSKTEQGRRIIREIFESLEPEEQIFAKLRFPSDGGIPAGLNKIGAALPSLKDKPIWDIRSVEKTILNKIGALLHTHPRYDMRRSPHRSP